MDSLHSFEGSNDLAFNNDSKASNGLRDRWKQMGSEEKRTIVQEEMKRVSHLPARSTYASHRMRVLNKILQLLSFEVTASEEEELELLFAGLSM